PVSVSSGVASTPYNLPPGLAAGSYTIQAVYNGTNNYARSTDMSHNLTVKPIAALSLSVDPNSDSGASNHDGLTTVTAPTFVVQATITFSEPVDLNTFTPAAVTFSGAAGSIPVNQPQLVSGATYRISFAAQAVEGAYSLTIDPSARDIAGNPLNQNQNGVNGE